MFDFLNNINLIASIVVSILTILGITIKYFNSKNLLIASIDKTYLKPEGLNNIKLIYDDKIELINPVILSIQIRKVGNYPIKKIHFDNYGFIFNDIYSAKAIVGSSIDANKFKLEHIDGHDKVSILPQIINKDDYLIFEILVEEKNLLSKAENIEIQHFYITGKIERVNTEMEKFSLRERYLRILKFESHLHVVGYFYLFLLLLILLTKLIVRYRYP